MSDKLREVIQKLKAKQNAQASNQAVPQAKPIPTPAPIGAETEEELIDDDVEAIPSETEEKAPTMPQKQATEPSQEDIHARQQQIMLLQDNGIFRAELLNQLQELNRAMVVIAEILADDRK